MPFDEKLADRVRKLLADRSDLAERRMFGGLTFMVRGYMCCGVQGDELILRLGPDGAREALASPHARPMDFAGRPLAGFITVSRNGLSGRALARWVERAVAWAESLPPKNIEATRAAVGRSSRRAPQMTARIDARVGSRPGHTGRRVATRHSRRVSPDLRNLPMRDSACCRRGHFRLEAGACRPSV
jgi:TfoX/Sxy family transcriptional regulator of competence genes